MKDEATKKGIGRKTEWLIRKSKKDPFSVLGIFIAIAGIAFSSILDILSQGDSISKSIDVLYSKSIKVKWGDLIAKKDGDANKVNIIFIVDNSGSTNYNITDQSLLENINMAMNDAQLLDISHTDKGYQCEPLYSEVVRAQLMLLLNKIMNDSINGTYEIKAFSKYATSIDKKDIKSLSKENIKKIVNSLTFEGVKTDFVTSLKNIVDEYKNASDKEIYTFIFLSDFVHEFDDMNKKNDDIASITGALKMMREKSVFSNIYIDTVLIKERKSKDLNKKLFVDELFEKVIQLEFKKISFLDHGFSVDYHISTHPLRFYFSSHMNDSTTIHITNLPKSTHIGVKKHKGEDSRQKFSVGGKPLYDSEPYEHFNDDILDVTITGHIPEQYPFAELTIRNDNNNLDYNFEIIFFKRIPEPFRWIIPLYICVLCCYLALLFAPLKNR
ncbi:MAG: hypothetical protein LBN06_04015 [Prevotellaceae bacterium]|jgi:hypothetical protein|nr:hypothetical protein [Prevotellaceae bacterium]